MHRTTSVYSDTIGGLTLQHVDQNLPTTNGTPVSAEWANAVQEELVNVVETAGLILETVPATDRTNGFSQVSDAIFASEAIDTAALTDGAVTDAKVASVGIDKLVLGSVSGEAEIFDYTSYPSIFNQVIFSPHELTLTSADLSGSPQELTKMELEEDSLTFTYSEDSVVKNQGVLTSSTLTLTDTATADLTKQGTYSEQQITLARDNTSTSEYEKAIMDYATGFISFTHDGSTFTGLAHIDCSGIEFLNSNQQIRFEVVDFSGSWVLGTPIYKVVETNIPNGKQIIDARFSYRKISDNRTILDEYSLGTFTTSTDGTNPHDHDVVVPVVRTQRIWVQDGSYANQECIVFAYGFDPGSVDYDRQQVIIWYYDD